MAVFDTVAVLAAAVGVKGVSPLQGVTVTVTTPCHDYRTPCRKDRNDFGIMQIIQESRLSSTTYKLITDGGGVNLQERSIKDELRSI
jgi:hypothetical protein